jgi:hypothetical protein
VDEGGGKLGRATKGALSWRVASPATRGILQFLRPFRGSADAPHNCRLSHRGRSPIVCFFSFHEDGKLPWPRSKGRVVNTCYFNEV